jgi:hypothetical protein
MANKVVQIGIRVDSDTDAQLEALCVYEQRSRPDMIRVLIFREYSRLKLSQKVEVNPQIEQQAQQG